MYNYLLIGYMSFCNILRVHIIIMYTNSKKKHRNRFKYQSVCSVIMRFEGTTDASENAKKIYMHQLHTISTITGDQMSSRCKKKNYIHIYTYILKIHMQQ